MKKMNRCLLMSLVLGILVLPLGISINPQLLAYAETTMDDDDDEDDDDEDEYDILNIDEVDDTDSLAIPFDDSELEDEEEINRAEKKDVFHIPHSR